MPRSDGRNYQWESKELNSNKSKQWNDEASEYLAAQYELIKHDKITIKAFLIRCLKRGIISGRQAEIVWLLSHKRGGKGLSYEKAQMQSRPTGTGPFNMPGNSQWHYHPDNMTSSRDVRIVCHKITLVTGESRRDVMKGLGLRAGTMQGDDVDYNMKKKSIRDNRKQQTPDNDTYEARKEFYELERLRTEDPSAYYKKIEEMGHEGLTELRRRMHAQNVSELKDTRAPEPRALRDRDFWDD